MQTYVVVLRHVPSDVITIVETADSVGEAVAAQRFHRRAIVREMRNEYVVQIDTTKAL